MGNHRYASINANPNRWMMTVHEQRIIATAKRAAKSQEQMARVFNEQGRLLVSSLRLSRIALYALLIALVCVPWWIGVLTITSWL